MTDAGATRILFDSRGRPGFAFGILQCGGVMPNGKTFRDTVRITFCLEQRSEGWRVVHQHVSKPMG